jgi:hypothetical protein
MRRGAIRRWTAAPYGVGAFNAAAIFGNAIYVAIIIGIIVIILVTWFYFRKLSLFGIILGDWLGAWTFYVRMVLSLILLATLIIIAISMVKNDLNDIAEIINTDALSLARGYEVAYPYALRIAAKTNPDNRALNALQVPAGIIVDLQTFTEVTVIGGLLATIDQVILQTPVPPPSLVRVWRGWFAYEPLRRTWYETSELYTPGCVAFVEKYVVNSRRPIYSWRWYGVWRYLTDTVTILFLITLVAIVLIGALYWFRVRRAAGADLHDEWSLFLDIAEAVLTAGTLAFLVYGVIEGYNAAIGEGNIESSAGTSVDFLVGWPYSIPLILQISPTNSYLQTITVPAGTNPDQIVWWTFSLGYELLSSIQYQLVLTPVPRPNLVRRWIQWYGSPLFLDMWNQTRDNYNLGMQDFVRRCILPFTIPYNVLECT